MPVSPLRITLVLFAVFAAGTVHAQPAPDVSGCAVASPTPADTTGGTFADDVRALRITKAMFADGTLWLVANRRLAALDICGSRLTWAARADTAVDLTSGADGVLYALTQTTTPRAFHVLRLSAEGDWEEVGAGPIQDGAYARGLAVAGGAVADDAVHTGTPGALDRHATPDDSLAWSLQPSFALMPDGSVYWSRNLGEWGGGLIRWSGDQPTLIGAADSTSGLDGASVTAVHPDPTRPGCIVAAVGIRHWMEDGRIVRVCDGHAEVLFRDPYPPLASDGDAPPLDEGTQAVFGLSPAPDGFWASGGRDVFRFRWAGGPPERFPVPELVGRDGVWLSTAIPGVIVLATTVNWSMSLSGPTALVVSTE